MATTEEILRAGFELGEAKGNILGATFDETNIPTLVKLLDSNSSSLQSVLGAGFNTLVFENTNGDAVRVESTTLGIAETPLSEAIVLQKAAEFIFEGLEVSARIYIRATPDDDGRTIDNEDLLRTAAILHANGKLDHWVDITPAQLMFIRNPTTDDLIRYPDGRAVAFIVDVNSAFEEKAPQAMGTARDYLKKAYNLDDQGLDATLEAAIPADKREAFLKAPEAQYAILDAVRARYTVPTQMTAATGQDVKPPRVEK